MPTVGSITKTIRINPRDLEVFEKLMEDGTSWSGAIHKLCEGVPKTEKTESEGVPEKEIIELGIVNTEVYVPREEYEKVLEELKKYKDEPDIHVVVGDDLTELMSYASIFGMSQEEYVREIKAAIDNGVLMNEGGHFVGRGKYDMSALEEKCKKFGMNVQSVINKMEKMIG